MKLLQLFERRIQKTEVLYHGTSSVFTKSILKHGLLANPPERTYNSKRNKGKAMQISHPSLETRSAGVYLTPSRQYAVDMAYNSIKAFDGNPIIIAVQITLGSTYIDEDEIIRYTVGALASFYSAHKKKPDVYGKTGKKFIKDSVAEIRFAIHTALGTLPENILEKNAKIIAEIFLYSYSPSIYKKRSPFLELMRRMEKRSEFRKATSEITKYMRREKRTKIFVTRNIGFKGKNKILGIEHVTMGMEQPPIYGLSMDEADPNYKSNTTEEL